MHIVLIDDDDSFRKLIALKLKSIFPQASFTSFCTLREARDGLKVCQEGSFDLVVCDEHLPDGRGSEFIAEGLFGNTAVLSVSSDGAPELAGSTVEAGARFFLKKQDITDTLFVPLVHGLVMRSTLEKRLALAEMNSAVLNSVKTLVATLRHEINNPLGAVLGAAYLLKSEGATTNTKLQEAAELVESSGKRIKHVLDELCSAIELEPVTKADQKVFHIPGDKPWNESK